MDESFHGKHSLRFHEISGKNIRFSNHMRLAERKERTFCDAIVFSQRPVAVNERVTIRLVKQSSDWNGLFKFGFTSLNPIHFKDEKNHPLPKYVYPDMTNQRGCWAASMLENVMHSGDSVYFYYTPNGEIHFGINDKYQGIFLDGVEVNQGQPAALWAVFDVYGNTTAIEFIKTSHHHQHQPNSTSSLMHDSSLADSLSSSSTLSASSSLDTNSLNTTIQSTSSYTNSSLSNTSTSIGSSSVITVIPNRNQPSRAQSALHNNNNKNNKIDNNVSN
jgi:protein neuralized